MDVALHIATGPLIHVRKGRQINAHPDQAASPLFKLGLALTVFRMVLKTDAPERSRAV